MRLFISSFTLRQWASSFSASSTSKRFCCRLLLMLIGSPPTALRFLSFVSLSLVTTSISCAVSRALINDPSFSSASASAVSPTLASCQRYTGMPVFLSTTSFPAASLATGIFSMADAFSVLPSLSPSVIVWMLPGPASVASPSCSTVVPVVASSSLSPGSVSLSVGMSSACPSVPFSAIPWRYPSSFWLTLPVSSIFSPVASYSWPTANGCIFFPFTASSVCTMYIPLKGSTSVTTPLTAWPSSPFTLTSSFC